MFGKELMQYEIIKFIDIFARTIYYKLQIVNSHYAREFSQNKMPKNVGKHYFLKNG